MIRRASAKYSDARRFASLARRERGGAWTLVVERKRCRDEVGRFAWFREGLNGKLHDTTVGFDDSTDAVKTAADFMKSDAGLCICSECGEAVSL